MALTATAWVQAVLPTDAAPSMGPTPNKYRIENKQRITRVRLTLSNASDAAAYPTSGGIPLPSFTPSDGFDYGMIRNLDYIQIYAYGQTGSGLVGASLGGQPYWVYSPTSHSIHGYGLATALASSQFGLNELSTQWTPTLTGAGLVVYLEAHGW